MSWLLTKTLHTKALLRNTNKFKDIFRKMNCIDDTDFKLFELMRNFRENDWLIDEKTGKKLQNSKITLKIFWNGSTKVFEFLESLSIDQIHNLWLSR